MGSIIFPGTSVMGDILHHTKFGLHILHIQSVLRKADLCPVITNIHLYKSEIRNMRAVYIKHVILLKDLAIAFANVYEYVIFCDSKNQHNIYFFKVTY